MNIDEAKSICEVLNDNFDSHDFICEYINRYPRSYGELLIKHNNVTTAHAVIANYLRNNSIALKIRKTGDAESTDIFTNNVSCATWEKVL